MAHLRRLEESLEHLWPEQVYAFDLACVERQWPVYSRAAHGRWWDRSRVLRGGIDAMWDWLCGAAQPDGFAAVCAAAVFGDTTGERADLSYVPAGAAETYALSFVMDIAELVTSIEDERPEDCVAWSRRTLNLVDGFACDTAAAGEAVGNGVLTDRHPLVQNAIRQQNADLALVTGTTEVASVIQQLRVQAASQSVLVDRWFPA